VQVTKFSQWFVIRVQNKMLAREVFIEKIHAPHSGCGLQQEPHPVKFDCIYLKSPWETLLGHVSRGNEDSKNTLFEIICHRPQEKI
jgi:hypothetical protein